MKWISFPDESGYYAWREVGKIEPHIVLAVVFFDVLSGFMRVQFEPDGNKWPLSDVAKRDWCKISDLNLPRI